MAARLFADAAALDPMFVDAVEAQGEVLDLTGHAELGRAKYAEARQVRSGIRPGAPDRPFVARQRGNFTSEILAYDAVIRSLRKNTLPYIARGNAHLAEGRPRLALADYERALKLKPKQWGVVALKAEALALMGRYSEALEAYDSVLRLRPDDAEALNGRGVVLAALGRVDDANADWRRQLALMADGPAAPRACIALRLADYQTALSCLDAAVAREPRDPYWRLYRLSVRVRLDMPVDDGVEPGLASAWPGPLFDLHGGQLTEAEVLDRADTADRRAEAQFQIAIRAVRVDFAKAERAWRDIVDHAKPALIEYGAARNELARIAA